MSLASWGLGVWRGLRPSLSRCDFVLLNNVKGFGLEPFLVEAGLEFGSLPAREVSDFEGKEGVSAVTESKGQLEEIPRCQIVELVVQRGRSETMERFREEVQGTALFASVSMFWRMTYPIVLNSVW